MTRSFTRMATTRIEHRVLADLDSRIRWDDQSHLSIDVETRQGPIQVRHGHYCGGVSDGVEVIEVNTGPTRALILPSRGMSIWRVQSDGVDFRWRSPVEGPVHPAAVPIFDPSGLGWLEGFDELVVRCGLESNGAPEHDKHGHLVHPLHGRIANLAAQSLSVEYDEASGRIEVIGEIIESRLFFKRLVLRSRIRFQAGSPDIDLLDDVTNELSSPMTSQLLYHVNLGDPVLDEASRIDLPIDSLAPKDALSAGEIDQWNLVNAPESGYSERVYFAKLLSDENQNTTALLRSASGKRGLAVSFHTAELSRFIVWKNTAALTDGYVVGLEPATNFPNTRSYEAQQGRVVEIQPGETKSFRLTIHPLSSEQRVEQFSQRVNDLRGDHEPDIYDQPRPGWTPGA